MTTYEEAGPVLTIRRRARTGFAVIMGIMSLIILATSVLLLVIKIRSADTIEVRCDRALGQCTVSPVTAGWKEQTLTLAELRSVHIEGAHGKRILYAGPDEPRAPGRHQLSSKTGERGELEAAAKKLTAFPDAADPTLLVTYPAGDSTLPWPALIVGILFGLVWMTPMLRAFKSVDIRLDKSAGTATAVWIKLARGRVERTVPLASIRAVRTWGATTTHDLVGVRLVVDGDDDLVVLGEGGFKAAKQEAAELSTRLSTFLSVPVEGS